MKAGALTCLNQPADAGAERTRAGWQRWGERRLTATERLAGWVCVVGLFGGYYRVNFANHPRQLRVKINGEIVRQS